MGKQKGMLVPLLIYETKKKNKNTNKSTPCRHHHSQQPLIPRAFVTVTAFEPPWILKEKYSRTDGFFYESYERKKEETGSYRGYEEERVLYFREQIN